MFLGEGGVYIHVVDSHYNDSLGPDKLLCYIEILYFRGASTIRCKEILYFGTGEIILRL